MKALTIKSVQGGLFMERINKNTSGIVLAASLLMAQSAMAAGVELNLDKAVKMALDNNVKVHMAQAELRNAEAGRTQAKASRWGSISYNHQFARSGSADVPNSIKNNYNNGFSATLPLFNQSLEGSISQAANNYKVANYGKDLALSTAMLEATNGYYTVLQATNSVTLARESVQRLTAHLKNAEAQYRVGVVAKVDVLRSKVELANAEQTLTKASNAYDLAVANLNNVIGLPLETQLHIKDGLGYQPYNYELDYCLAYAMANHAGVHQAGAGVKIAKAGVQIASASNTPSIAATATKGWGGKNFSGSKQESWNVGVGLNMNVFDYGVTDAKTRAARANVDKAEMSYRQVADNIQLNVRNSYLSMKESEKRIGTAHTAVAMAEEDYRIAVLSYRAGVATNTDVMDAQVSLTNAKTNYVQALYDYNTAKTKLQDAMGTPIPEKYLDKPVKIAATMSNKEQEKNK